MTKHVPFTEARARLSDLLDDVESKQEHVVISRNGKEVAILLSVNEYESLIETLEVLEDPERSPLSPRRTRTSRPAA